MLSLINFTIHINFETIPKQTNNKQTRTTKKLFLPFLSFSLSLSLTVVLNYLITESNNNGENETETPKSSEDDENNSEESSSNDTNHLDSSNNQLIKWTAEDLVAIDDSEEKIYEDLCYVTISSTFPSEVFINPNRILCYLICSLHFPFPSIPESPSPPPLAVEKSVLFVLFVQLLPKTL